MCVCVGKEGARRERRHLTLYDNDMQVHMRSSSSSIGVGERKRSICLFLSTLIPSPFLHFFSCGEERKKTIVSSSLGICPPSSFFPSSIAQTQLSLSSSSRGVLAVILEEEDEDGGGAGDEEDLDDLGGTAGRGLEEEEALVNEAIGADDDGDEADISSSRTGECRPKLLVS